MPYRRKKLTFAISSPDEFLFLKAFRRLLANILETHPDVACMSLIEALLPLMYVKCSFLDDYREQFAAKPSCTSDIIARSRSKPWSHKICNSVTTARLRHFRKHCVPLRLYRLDYTHGKDHHHHHHILFSNTT